METRIVALFPLCIDSLREQPGVVMRRRRDGKIWTQVLCEIESEGDQFFARPHATLPDVAPRPEYRANLELSREEMATTGVAVVLQPLEQASLPDPEQRLISPIYVSTERVLFEFNRAEVLFLAPTGYVDLRLVAVDRRTGEVGTRALGTFHTRWSKLLARCTAHLEGSLDLFPVTQAATGWRSREVAIPTGGADLSFGRRIV